MLNNNISYTQISFVFLLQKDLYFDHDDTDVCIIFLIQKDFNIFYLLLFEAFLCFLIMFIYHFHIYLTYVYKIYFFLFRKKCIQNKCISFYIYSKSRKNCMKSLEFVLNTIFLVLDTFQTLLLNIYKDGKPRPEE